MRKRKVGEVGMSYQSPIEVFRTQMQSQIEGEIYKAVMKVGVNVDKDELLKVLQYDRDQYQKGYTDRDSEIVRCKDCRNGESDINYYGDKCVRCHNPSNGVANVWHKPDWFCADGVKEQS